MQDWHYFVIGGIAIFFSLPSVRNQWRQDRVGYIRSVAALAGFAGYCALGIFFLISLMPEPPVATVQAVSLTLFFLGWTALGGVWLVRLAPRYRELPDRILRPNVVVDGALLAFPAGMLALFFFG